MEAPEDRDEVWIKHLHEDLDRLLDLALFLGLSAEQIAQELRDRADRLLEEEAESC